MKFFWGQSGGRSVKRKRSHSNPQNFLGKQKFRKWGRGTGTAKYYLKDSLNMKWYSRATGAPMCQFVFLCARFIVCDLVYFYVFVCVCACEYEMVFKSSRGANVPIKKSPRSEWLPHCQDSWEKTQHLPSRQILVLRS